MAIRSVASPGPSSTSGGSAEAAPTLRTPAPLTPSADVRSPLRPLARRARAQLRTTLERALPALLLGLAFLLGWQLIALSGLVATYFLPAPADVARAFGLGLRDGMLLSYGQVTFVESLLGFALGTTVALPLGYAVARSRLLARAFQPYLAASQAVPAVALAPLLALWLPYGLPSVVVLCALIVFFPTVVNTALGLRTLDPDVLASARVAGAGRWELLRHIEAPLALPSILVGLRTSLTLSITGAVVGEFVVGDQGLGGLLNVARSNLDTALVFATLVSLALLAALFYGIALLAERRFSYLEEA